MHKCTVDTSAQGISITLHNLRGLLEWQPFTVLSAVKAILFLQRVKRLQDGVDCIIEHIMVLFWSFLVPLKL